MDGEGTRNEFDTCFEGVAFAEMKRMMGERKAGLLFAEAAGRTRPRGRVDSPCREASTTSPLRWGVVLLVASHFLAILSLLSWLAFLSHGAFGVVVLGLDYTGALLLDAFLSLLFFAQHSIMVRTSFKRWMARFVGPDYHGAVYAAASGIALLGLTLLWQAPAPARIVLRGVPLMLGYALSILALAGFIWGVRALGSFDIFGSGPILRSLRNEPPIEPTPLAIRGPYRWVRHPLYFCCLLAIWTVPELTADRLLYNVMWSGWIVAGTMLEERDLAKAFGTAYRDYKKKVPMLVPWRIVPVPSSQPAGGPTEARAGKQIIR